MAIHALLQTKLGKSVKDASDREIYEALLTVVKELAEERENCPAKETDTGKKKIYYVSAEFLIGKLLSNNMINLGIYDEVKELLAENGKDLAAIWQREILYVFLVGLLISIAVELLLMTPTVFWGIKDHLFFSGISSILGAGLCLIGIKHTLQQCMEIEK